MDFVHLRNGPYTKVNKRADGKWSLYKYIARSAIYKWIIPNAAFYNNYNKEKQIYVLM